MTPPPALLYSVVLMMDVTICANNIKGQSVKKSHYRGGITNIFVEDCRFLHMEQNVNGRSLPRSTLIDQN